MNQFIHVQKGIKKIMIAQIVAIVSTVFSSVLSFLLLLLGINVSSAEYSGPELIWITIYAVLGFCSVVAIVVTMIISIWGFLQASKDEPEFKKAMICTAVSGTVLVFGSVFHIPNGAIYTILTSVASIVEMFVAIFGLSGMIIIADRCERSDVKASGNFWMKIMVLTYFIISINALVIRIFELSSQARMISAIFGVFDLVLSASQYIIFWMYSRKVLHMLKHYQEG